MELWIVRMLRWGSPEEHSYIVGVYDSEDKALATAEVEEQYRGGKYDAKVICVELNRPIVHRDIHKSEEDD